MKKRIGRIVGGVLLAVLVVLLAGAAVFTDGSYRAEEEAYAAIRASGDGITVTEQDGMLLFVPEGATKGFIFYPGARVQAEAYAPLMRRIAERGAACVLVQMPCNAALLNINAADRVYDALPQIEEWYIGGHSMGGAAAGSYAAGHADRVKGVALLGAYTTHTLDGLSALSVYGSEDHVLNRKNYETYRANLPADATELVIEGGCHALFGNYGAQKGDGVPSVSAEEQQTVTAAAIAQWMDV